MKYTSVIFDLDGTLLDTLQDLSDSVNYIMNKYGYAEKTSEQVREYVGNGVARLIEQCIPKGAENEGFAVILSDFKRHYDKNCLIKTKPYPGVLELLRTLYDKGVKLSIVSNKPDPAVKTLCGLFFKDYIQTAVGDTGNGIKKPSPEPVLSAIAQMGAQKESTVYIGDSEVDILTARNAGMDCILVSWGFRSVSFLKEHGAKTIIDSPRQILAYV